MFSARREPGRSFGHTPSVELQESVQPWYRERAASPDLHEALACTWQASVGGPSHTLVPDGCLDLLWIEGGALWLCGPETSAWTFRLPADTSAVGIRFRPAVAPPVLGLDASEVVNTRIRVEDLWGDRAARHLRDRLEAAGDDAGRVAVLADLARERISEAPPVDDVARAVVVQLDERRAPVHALARELGISERQLRRRCTAAFGYGPSVLSRILRLQRFLSLARRSSSAGLAELAIAAGYADQPHLSREVRTIATTTPARLRHAA
jgi:AraC-like DNA-binding protein